MKKVCWLLLFAFLPLILPAQYEEILKNPDVIWAAEIDVLYTLTPTEFADSTHQNDIVFWKNYDPKNRTPYDGCELMMENILSVIRAGKWPARKFKGKLWQIDTADSTDAQFGYDTVVVFDPLTEMELVKAVKNDWDPFDAIRAKQLIYFNEKKGDFELFTAGIAPAFRMPKQYDPENEMIEWEETHQFYYMPFWLKMPGFSKKKNQMPLKVNDPNITWAAQIRTLSNSPYLNKQRVLKDTKPPVMQVLLDRFLQDRHYMAQNSLGEPIPFKGRNSLISSTDTLVTFDPETYEQKTEIIKKTADIMETPRLRLIENWFWDERQQRLVIQLARYAPIVARNDDWRFIYYDKPLFFRQKE